jgi:hypothetical protein
MLPCPYLLLVVDFDAPGGTAAELRAYLRDVWTNMRADLEPVFKHCHGYAQKAVSADGFADYVIDCQLETTMPFNDYWPASPPLAALSKWLLGFASLAAALAVGAGLWVLLGAAAHGALHIALIVAVAVLAIAAGLCVAYRIVMARGARAFPMAPNSDLRSVLKALYLQRELIAFSLKMQGRANQEIFDAFGAFLARVNVDDPDNPSQSPGTIRP